MASPIAADSFLSWDPAQVSNYISGIDRKIGTLFLDHNLDGSLLPHLTTEHLRELGIEKLSLRLQIKKAIADLVYSHSSKPESNTNLNIPYANINNNYIHIESLTVALTLLRESFKKASEHQLSSQSSVSSQSTSSPSSPTQQQLDIRKLNENFNKLKSELIPAMRLLKESKPLPTPTLDPGSTIGKSLDSPTFSISSSNTFTDVNAENSKPAGTSTRRNSLVASTQNRNSSMPSPTFSTNRFSSGSLLSMGTGKIIQQSVVTTENSRAPNFTLQKISHRDRNQGQGQVSQRPRLVETVSANSINNNPTKPGIRPHLTSASASSSSTATSGMNSSVPPPPPSSSSSSQPTNNEPLKQLRASSEDSCLKVLQQAMKRHHIPRDDWSKYVLVICYGDKERILKLAEKPVIIFKELQELGKHPAIMLRQLATTKEEEDDVLYEDSRIGDDIPGGTL
ncbi:hypothetical protein CAAN1_11S01508 [[Candida] anglica]|uniref:Ste50p n=1 Tax=[Candida] anglica TaxID=148631 RepID=A0ABP0EMF4_9ASCO